MWIDPETARFKLGSVGNYGDSLFCPFTRLYLLEARLYHWLRPTGRISGLLCLLLMFAPHSLNLRLERLILFLLSRQKPGGKRGLFR